MLKGFLLMMWGIVLTNTLQIKVLSQDTPYDAPQQLELNSLRLAINFNSKYIYPHRPNTFNLPNLPFGRNFVQVVSQNYAYPLLMIDSRQTGEVAYNLVHPFTKQIIERVSEPILLKPVERIQYLLEEPGFKLTTFLFSGPGLMIMIGGGLYLCYKSIMPKLEEAQMAPQAQQRQ